MNWRIEESERAEADRDAAFDRLMNVYGSDLADQWHDGLLAAIAALADFPGPRSHPLASEEGELFRLEVRRLLYRWRGTAWRVLFTVANMPEPDESADEPAGRIRVLRILHAAARPLWQSEENDS